MAGVLRVYAIPALEAAGSCANVLDLAHGTDRLIDLLCRDPGSSARNGACTLITEDYVRAMEHLEGGRTGPAANIMNSVIARADDALKVGAFTEEEHALIAGGVRQVLARI